VSPKDVLGLIREANALESVDRTGFAMCGVSRPETVAAHSFGVLAAAFGIADMLEEPVDRGRLALIALLHDLPEARVGDTPLIIKTDADDAREDRAMEEILAGLPEHYRSAWEEYRALESLEARIVHGCDKLQMMAKVAEYERAGEEGLAAFWENPRNFRDGDLPEIRAVYEAIVRSRGRTGASPPPGRS